MSSNLNTVPGSPLIPIALRPNILYTPGLLQDTVTNSAINIGCTEAQVAKSIVVEPSFGTSKANNGGSPNEPTNPELQEDHSLAAPFLDKGIPPVFLFVLAGSTKINLRKVQKTLAPLYGSSKGTPAPPTSFKLLSRDQVLQRTGYPPGAVAPLGLTQDKVAVYLDISLRAAVEEAKKKREQLKQNGGVVDSLSDEDSMEQEQQPSDVDYLNYQIPVYKTRDRTADPLVFCSAGTLDTSVQLTLKEMEKWSSFIEWVDVGGGLVGEKNPSSPLSDTATAAPSSSPNVERSLFPSELLSRVQHLSSDSDISSSPAGSSVSSEKAKQLQCSLAQIAQCVLIQVAVPGNKNPSASGAVPLPVFVFVAAGNTKIVQKKVNKILAASISAKDASQKYSGSYKIMTGEKVAQLTGFPPGVVTPVGLPSVGFEVYLDHSLKTAVKAEESSDDAPQNSVLYIMGESPSSVVGITVQELEKYSRSVQWVDVFVPQ